MGETTSNIVVTATNKARQTLQQVSTDFDHISTRAKSAQDNISKIQAPRGLSDLKGALQGVGQQIPVIGQLSGALAALAGPAAFAGLAAGVAKLGWELGSLAASAERSEKYFVAFSGSAGNAARNLDAVQKATGNAVDKQIAMQAASNYLSMGLATNSEQLAQLTHMAVMLGGGTRTATESLEEFALLLANQSILRLDTFGISGARVRQRIEELTAADASLSREQAFLNAVLEIGGQKVKQLEEAGVTAGTATDRLAASWNNLKVVLGENTAGPVSNAKNQLTGVMEGVTRFEGGQAAREYENAANRIAKAQSELAAWYVQINPLAKANKEAQVEQAYAMYAVAQNAVLEAQGFEQAATSGDMLAQAAQRAANSADAVASSAPAAAFGITDMGLAAKYAAGLIADAGNALEELNRRAAGFKINTGALMPNVDWDKALQEQSFGGQYSDYYESFLPAGSQRQWAKMVESGLTSAGQSANRTYLAGLESAGKKGATAWEKEMDTAISTMSGKLQEGMDYSKGLGNLLPGGEKGANAPGAGGAFEDIYRLQAFIQNGSWAETAAKFGLDKAGATDIVRKFQQGIFDETVKSVIDVNKLVEQIRTSDAAAKTQEAFAAELAKAAGTSKVSVKDTLGFTDDKLTTAGGEVGKAMGAALDAQKSTVESAGKGVGQSMIDGLSLQDQSFYDKGFAQAQLYTKGYADGLGAHSPSREMMKLGRSALEGFVIGAGGSAGGATITGVGGRRRAAASTVVWSSKYVAGDRNVYNIYSEGAAAMALGLGRSAKMRRLGA